MHYSHAQSEQALITQAQYKLLFSSVYVGCYKVQYLQNGRTSGMSQCYKDKVIFPAELDASLRLVLDEQAQAYLLNNVAMFGLEIYSAAEVRLRRTKSIPCFDYICFTGLYLHLFGMVAALL